MGNVPETDTERNEKLIKDYNAKKADGSRKFSILELQFRYNISATRIYQILEKYKNIQK